MAGLNSGPETDSQAPRQALTSRRFFATIAWLRWRIFLNTLRGKGGTSELVVKFLSYPLLALMVLGPSIGAGFGAWYFVSRGMDAYLAIPLWIIFVLWQVIGVSTSASGPSFDLNSLARFPISYPDYLLMRLSFGLLDPPTLAGVCCLISMTLAITIAAPALFPWAAITLATYAACNLFFSRMVYSWMERWLAQRRTREMITVVILLGSLVVQVASQYASRLGSHDKPLSPWMLQSAQVLLAINWALPPGLSAFSIEHMHNGYTLLGVGAFAALLAYTAAFLVTLHFRLHAQYLGESMSEAPAALSRASKRSRPPALINDGVTWAGSSGGFAILPATIASLLVKELRLLLRSGPKLYTLIMPVFIVCLVSLRGTGMDQAGIRHGGIGLYMFPYACAYMQLIFVVFMYNALGGDGAGVQFYFIAPLRIREVMLAKNLMIGIILVLEVVLIYLATLFLSVHTPPSLIAATLAWTLFAFIVNLSIGNIRSIVSPKGVDPTKVRRQNVSTVNSFVSLAVVFSACVLGQLILLLCRWFHISYLVAAGLFAVLALLAAVLYWIVLNRLDQIAMDNVENLTRELCKA